MTETPRGYFDDLWAGSADPWEHAVRWYEARKYDLTVAALPAVRYLHAVEPACGTGLLTQRLAQRASRVTATDRFERAAVEAARRCASSPHVSVGVADVRDGPPAEPFDLAVISEVLYYFDTDTVADVVRRWHDACTTGGHVVLVHYRRPVTEHVLTGDEAHGVAGAVLGRSAVTLIDPDFRLEVFEACSSPCPPAPRSGDVTNGSGVATSSIG